MAELTPALKKVLIDCGLGGDACWKHKQSGKWVIYHWACEAIAAKKQITFDPPTIVQADAEKKLAVIVVSGHPQGEANKAEWSFGEAAPYNTTQSYPFAMAEKRAKDRVVLKLVGLHGEAYSEEEADAFKQGGPVPTGMFTPLPKMKLEAAMRKFCADLEDCTDLDQVAGLQESNKAELKQCADQHPIWWKGNGDQPGVKERIENRKKAIEQSEEYAA